MHPYDQYRRANCILIEPGATANAPEGKSFYMLQNFGTAAPANFDVLVPATGAMCIGTTGSLGIGGLVGTAAMIAGATFVSSANFELSHLSGPIYGNWRQVKLVAGDRVVAYFA